MLGSLIVTAALCGQFGGVVEPKRADPPPGSRKQRARIARQRKRDHPEPPPARKAKPKLGAMSVGPGQTRPGTMSHRTPDKNATKTQMEIHMVPDMGATGSWSDSPR